MVKKIKTPLDPQDLQALPTSLRESAQQIWMAGLSAFAKAQSGGNKVFEALMKEGQALPERTRKAARDQVDEMAAKAGGTWDKLEQVFETRVAQALHSLGVPTRDDIDRLSRRVAELSALVQTLQAGGATTPGPSGEASTRKTRRPTKAAAAVARKAAPKGASAQPVAGKRVASKSASAKRKKAEA